jgi:hypothetical protein
MYFSLNPVLKFELYYDGVTCRRKWNLNGGTLGCLGAGWLSQKDSQGRVRQFHFWPLHKYCHVTSLKNCLRTSKEAELV